jgi:hypothetical protein
MLFGLMNVLATFQALMNHVLWLFLRHFLLIFFDDILVYSRSWSEHLQHLRLVLTVLKEHQLFMKRSKCAFDHTEVTYLSHVISNASVAMDQNKV